jgi:hypothetical protein
MPRCLRTSTRNHLRAPDDLICRHSGRQHRCFETAPIAARVATIDGCAIGFGPIGRLHHAHLSRAWRGESALQIGYGSVGDSQGGAAPAWR